MKIKHEITLLYIILIVLILIIIKLSGEIGTAEEAYNKLVEKPNNCQIVNIYQLGNDTTLLALVEESLKDYANEY